MIAEGMFKPPPGIRYVVFNKMTMPPTQCMRTWQFLFKEITVAGAKVIWKHRADYEEVHSQPFWRKNLKQLCRNGRFLACDKNQGVRFVDHETYKKIAAREYGNYELHPDATGKEMEKLANAMLDKLKGNLKFLAVTIQTAAIKKTITYHDNEQNRMLKQLAEFVAWTASKPTELFRLPALRMLLKVHKVIKAGALCPTRPIVPACGLPSYPMGQWLGAFMARMAKQIKWNLQSTEQFLSFITDPSRSSRVRCYDFTNLYGSEPVKETINLFVRAIEELAWIFEDPNDDIIFKALMRHVIIPDGMELDEIIGRKSTRLIVLLVAECIRGTLATLDLGDEEKIIGTNRFLAMGCPPVAPLSIITLAYLEVKQHGREKCEIGMRRLIDDIIVDLDIISETNLYAAYSKHSYLELNVADYDHFLDVRFTWNGERHITYPYIKEFAVVPLNYFSNHPQHTIRAAAKNELRRLMGLINIDSAKPDWVEYWHTKYSMAQYPSNILRNILLEVISGTRLLREKEERGVNNIETWRGAHTGVDKSLTKETGFKVDTAWKVSTTLMSMALKMHKTDGL